jgi:hypothetical protein
MILSRLRLVSSFKLLASFKLRYLSFDGAHSLGVDGSREHSRVADIAGEVIVAIFQGETSI